MTTAGSTAAPGSAARLLATVGTSTGLDTHLSVYGRLEQPRDLVRLAHDARLRGRGGAGFPVARKLAAVMSQDGQPIVLANGAETEPASKKDRSLLRVAPHLVIDGAAAAAAALGARRIVVAVTKQAPELERAVAERTRRDTAGCDVVVHRVDDRFVAGEETALIHALNGGPPKPTLKPPFPFERGIDGRPTLVQNVETLAHLALVARFGPAWYGAGTALVTLSGAVAQPGVHELPLGVTLAEAIARCGGNAAPVAGYLVGGYFGGWVTPDAATTLRLTSETLGAGAIVALPQSTCALAECGRVIRYLADESAGQCGPCFHGLGAIADSFAAGRHAQIRRFTDLVESRGACRHPDGAARFVRSTLEVFAREIERHATQGDCGRPCERVLPVGTGA